MQEIVQRPTFQSVSLADGLAWKPGKDWIFQEKKDGVWAVREIANSIVVGEQMRDGRFYAFDLLKISGQSIASEPLRFRLATLADFIRQHPTIQPVPVVSGGEGLEAILRDGGEGVVAKKLSSPFGATWWKCKRQETYDCRVVEIHHRKRSVRLAMNGQDCGWLSTPKHIPGVGQMVEVACHSIHPSGKFREPVLIRMRPDKL